MPKVGIQVLIVTALPANSYGGVANHIKNLHSALVNQEKTNIKLFYMPSFLENWPILGGTFLLNRLHNGLGSLYALWIRQILIKIFLRNKIEKYDLIHVQDPMLGVAIVDLIAKLNHQKRPRIIVSNYGLGPATQEMLVYKGLSGIDIQRSRIWRTIWYWESAGYQGADIVLTDSKISRDQLAEHFLLDLQKMEVIYPGVDEEKYHSITEQESQVVRTKLGIKKDEIVISVIAALTRLKGQKTLLEAVAHINHKIGNVHFLIVGKGPQKSALENLARKLGIEEKVRFLGFWPDAKEIFAISDVFILPSYQESTSLAMIEAALSNVPILATKVGGATELFTHMKSAYLVEINDPGQLADGIFWMLSNPNKSAKLAEQAHEIILENCTIDSMGQNYMKLYRSLLHRNNHDE